MVIPVLSPSLKDWLQALSWLAAAGGILVTIVKFRSDLRLGRIQRERELRWRQADAGKALNDELQMDPLAWPALQMLDDDGREFKLPDGTTAAITHAQIRAALDPERKLKDPTSVYILDCFDTLFYYLAAMDHYVASSLIDPGDVAYPMEYYIPLLARLRPEIDRYIARYELWRTKQYLDHQPRWIEATSIAKQMLKPAQV